MSDNAIENAIRDRRSVRRFESAPVDARDLQALLEGARWAPSGLNNQPWRFITITDRTVMDRLASLTKYRAIVRSCAACVAVFFHLPSGYNRDKDLMSIGAAIQNILLTAHSRGLGAVWLGEILNKKNDASAILETDADHELMALIALGHPAESPASTRASIESLVLKKI
jgi:nitroreductase